MSTNEDGQQETSPDPEGQAALVSKPLDTVVEEAAPRTRVRETRFVGLVIEWKGYMGWIQTFEKIEHEQAQKHQGRIYLNVKDISPMDENNWRVKQGKIVDFFVYVDEDGMGAEQCRPRSVLRLTMPHSEVKANVKFVPKWNDYLFDSEYFLELESEHGVLVRKYLWPMPFVIFELWGHTDGLVSAALQLLSKDGQEEYDVRLLLADTDIPKVEGLPHSPKVSASPVFTDPMPCHSLRYQTTREQCSEALLALIKAVS
jgi:hypothetical protein